jgi:hypothetical protein
MLRPISTTLPFWWLVFSLFCVFFATGVPQAWAQPVPEARRWLQQPWHQLEPDLQNRLKNLPDDQARILFLRDVVFQLALWPNGTDHERLPSSRQLFGDELYKVPVGRLMNLLTQDSMSTICGDLAEILAKLCTHFGYPACTIGMGEENGTFGHMATLVEYIDPQTHQRVYTFHDPSYGYSYADSTGRLLSLDSIIMYIERKQTDRLVELFSQQNLSTRLLLTKLQAASLHVLGKPVSRVKPTRNQRLSDYLLIDRDPHFELASSKLYRQFARFGAVNGFEKSHRAILAINTRLFGQVNRRIIGFNTWRYVQNMDPMYYHIPEAKRFKVRLG